MSDLVHIYLDNGGLIVLDEESSRLFREGRSEVSENPNSNALYSRYQTAAAVVRCVQSMIPAMDSTPDVWQEFWDVVNASGAFTDEELFSLGITAAQLASFVTVLENYNKFMTNGGPAPDIYKTSLNMARRLSA